MGLKQRHWRGKLTDLQLDALIKRLMKRYKADSESELITMLLLEADKKQVES